MVDFYVHNENGNPATDWTVFANDFFVYVERVDCCDCCRDNGRLDWSTQSARASHRQVNDKLPGIDFSEPDEVDDVEPFVDPIDDAVNEPVVIPDMVPVDEHLHTTDMSDIIEIIQKEFNEKELEFNDHFDGNFDDNLEAIGE